MEIRILVLMLFPCLASGEMKLTAPPSHLAIKGSDAVLPCIFKLKEPVDEYYLAVIWYFNDTEVLVNYPPRDNARRPEMSLYLPGVKMGNASLLISGVKLSHSGRYKCCVIHSPENQERNIVMTVQARPAVKVIGRIVRPHEQNTLHCLVTGFYPHNINVIWFRGSEVMKTYVTLEVKRQEDGTFNGNSTAIILHTEEAMNETFTCQVRHKSLSSPLQKRFRLVYEELQDDTMRTASTIAISALCVVIVLITVTCAIFLLWRKDKESEQAATWRVVPGKKRPTRTTQSTSSSSPQEKLPILIAKDSTAMVIPGLELVPQVKSKISEENQEQLSQKQKASSLPRNISTPLEDVNKGLLNPTGATSARSWR
ncbi:natural cytotoxicity triggering receptor 3 ligand 1-like [Mantella aurantiaca]